MIVNFLQLTTRITSIIGGPVISRENARKTIICHKNRIHAIRSVRVACTFCSRNLLSFFFQCLNIHLSRLKCKNFGRYQATRTNQFDGCTGNAYATKTIWDMYVMRECVRPHVREMHWRCVVKREGLRREGRKKALYTPWHRVPLSGQWRWVNGYTRSRSSKLQTMRSKCA